MSKIKSYYEDLYGENWTDRINETNNDNYEEETNGRSNN